MSGVLSPLYHKTLRLPAGIIYFTNSAQRGAAHQHPLTGKLKTYFWNWRSNCVDCRWSYGQTDRQTDRLVLGWKQTRYICALRTDIHSSSAACLLEYIQKEAPKHKLTCQQNLFLNAPKNFRHQMTTIREILNFVLEIKRFISHHCTKYV